MRKLVVLGAVGEKVAEILLSTFPNDVLFIPELSELEKHSDGSEILYIDDSDCLMYFIGSNEKRLIVSSRIEQEVLRSVFLGPVFVLNGFPERAKHLERFFQEIVNDLE